MNQLLEAALQYADMGIAIIPCYPNSKNPIGDEWEARATTDKDQIRKWWTETPEANIGGKTGEMSGGIVGVDLDEKNGQHGIEQFADWEKQNGIKTPETPKVKTPHGGIHIYFKATSYVPSVRHGTWLQDVDTRGWTGQILLPPSIVDGERYEWVVSPEDADFASESEYAAVSFLLDSIREAEANKSSGTFTAPAEILDGERNNTLFREACSLQSKGLCDEAIYAAIETENKTKCNPPLPDREVHSLIKSALKYEKGKPIEWKSTAAGDGKKNGDNKPDLSIWDDLEPVSIADLIEMDIPDVYFPVKNFLPEGLSYIGAYPKSGKSWLMMEMCVAVATGQSFLGHETVQSDVLYFDLENPDIGLKNRLEKTSSSLQVPKNVRVIFREQILEKVKDQKIPKLGTGFEYIIEKQLQKNPKIRLVIIDTLFHVSSRKLRDETDYDRDSRNGQILKDVAQKYHVSIVVVTHTTKLKYDENIFLNISGTSGVTGMSNSNMVMMKEHKNSDVSILAIQGRYAGDHVLNLRFDRNTCRWIYLGEASADPADREEQQREEEFLSSDIREAVKTVCEKDFEGYKGFVSGFVQKAAAYGVGISEANKTIGKFLSDNVGLFAKHDGITISAVKNGTGSRIYSMKLWQPADTETEI